MKQYDKTVEPPIPVIDCQLLNPKLGSSEKVEAIVDTGADMTVVSVKTIEKLGLHPVGTVLMGPPGEEPQECPAYYVHMLLNGMKFDWLKVSCLQADESLLGRDILNRLKVVLDGKSLSLDVEDP